MEDQHIEGIPNGNWLLIDQPWYDGNYYYWIDTATKTLYGFYFKTESCGCCSYLVDTEWDWDSLEDGAKKLIIEEFTEKNTKEMNNIEFKDVHTESGIYGNFPFGVKISLAGDIELTKEDKYVIYECAEKLKEMALSRMLVSDPKEIFARNREREDILALFDKPIYVDEIPNGYTNSWYSKSRPWFIVTTNRGRIKIGWRKSVISIDWNDTNIPDKADILFPDEKVTKDGRLIHAWGLKNAKRYIDILINS